MSNPDWFVLMKEWVAQNHGDRGVTLPFLVGALAYKQNNEASSWKDARSVLTQMIEQPVENHVTEIAWCSSLGTPILTAATAPSPFQPQVGFRYPSSEIMSLVFGLDLQNRWNSSNGNDLLESLLDDAEVAIHDRTYSRDPTSKTYKPFQPWEKRFIEETIMAPTRA